MITTIKGKKTDCVTGKIKLVDVDFKIDNNKNGKLLDCVNGVTGQECWYIDKDFILGIQQRGRLLICAGTKNQYDKLEVSWKELEKVFVKNNLIRIAYETIR